jgi:hypothetical protein
VHFGGRVATLILFCRVEIAQSPELRNMVLDELFTPRRDPTSTISVIAIIKVCISDRDAGLWDNE